MNEQLIRDVIAQLIMAVLPILLTVLTAAITLLLNRARAWLNARIEQEHLATIRGIVVEVAQFVEQLARKHGAFDTAEQKRDAALDEIQRRLDEAGFTGISAETILNMLEAAIRQGLHSPPDIGAATVVFGADVPTNHAG